MIAKVIVKMIKGKIVRTIREKYFNPDKKTYTNVDMDSFSLSEKIKKDKRTFFEYYWEIVNDYNAISFAFIKMRNNLVYFVIR